MKHFDVLSRSKLLSLAILSALPMFPAVLQAQTQDFWNGGSGDYNVGANWSLGVVPASGYSANNDTGSNNIIFINDGDPAWTLNGFRIGINGSGAVVQNGSTVTLGATQNGWLRLGITDPGSVGYYTINGNAVFHTPSGITVGEIGNGVLNINGGTTTVGAKFVVNSNGPSGSSGTVNQTGGTVTSSSELWVGQGTGGQNGVYNMSGGSLTVNNWLVLGRSGGSGTMNLTNGTVTKSGTGDFDVGTGFQGSGTGVLNQYGGTIIITNGSIFVVPETSPGNGTYNLSGGALYSDSWICIGRGGVGTLNMSGGMIAKLTGNGNSHFDVGAGGDASGSGTGTINQTGGVITNTTTDFWLGEVANATWNMDGGTNYIGNLIIAQGKGIFSSMTINGGLLSVGAIYSAQPGPSFSALNLNGGTIQATGNSSSFINNLSSVSLQPGGVTFDTQGYAVTIPQALGDGGGGGIVKIGSGTLTLSGANSYNGPTVVSNGILATTTTSTGGGDFTAVDGTTLNVSVASAGSQLSTANLTMGSGSGATLGINLDSLGNPSVAPVNVSGTLTIKGTLTINVADSLPAVGEFPLISYGSLAGGGTIQIGNLSPGMVATLNNNTANHSINLVVTSAGAPYWTGNVSGGVWDVGTTANWTDLATGVSEPFQNGEPVVFNDNATGTTTISLGTTVQPGSISINNTALPYTLTGSGSIAGTTGLTKEGANVFTIAGTINNTYTGPTTIQGGVLSVGSLANGGSASGIGASSANPTNLVLAGGTLSYTGPAALTDRGYVGTDTNGVVDIDAEGNLAIGGPVIAGIGSGFTKAGPALLAYLSSGINALSDTRGYTVAEGPVVFSGLGSGQTNGVAGSLVVGIDGSTNASLTVGTNTTLALTTTGSLIVGNGNTNASSGTFNQQGGLVNLVGNYEVWIGQGSNGVGTLNLTGGTMNVSNWMAIGREGGIGTLNMSSNAMLIIRRAGAFDIGTSAGINGYAGTGTFNQTGGVFTNNCPTWLGEGTTGEPAQGVWNMSGGTAWLQGNVGQNAPAALMVGQSGIGTNTLNVSGTASITCGNLVSLGQNSGVTGILNIGNASQPGGTFTMSGGQDFNVGNNGIGVLNMVAGGGGQLTVPGTMYLTRGSSASGTVNLNAGSTIQVGYINNGYGFGNNLKNNPQSFNFNGGTLKANIGSPYFIQPYVNTVVQAGGAIIDDGGYTISIESVLADGGGNGGLTKLGSGTLYLTAANTYTGTTLVSAGTLGLDTSASIAGPVTVASGAALSGDAGTIGTCFINNTLTLNAGSTTVMKIAASSNDQIAGLTGVTYGGSLVLTNTSGTPLTVGNVYKLFNSAVPGINNFASVTILPSGAGTFNPADGTLTITSQNQNGPTVNPPAIANGNLIFTGTGGTAGSGYTVLSSTNLSLPMSQWVTSATGSFNSDGTFSNAIPIININTPAMFFRLKTAN